MKIHKQILSLTLLIFALTFVSCSGGGGGGGDNPNPNPNPTNGTLKLKISVYNSYQPLKEGSYKTTPDEYTSEVTDIRSSNIQIRVTSDNISAGVADDFDWTTAYSSSSTVTASSIDASFSVPAGTIRGLSISQNNQIEWVCSHNGSSINITDLINSQLATNATSYQIYGSGGSYEISGGVTQKTGDANFSPVTITAGQTTTVTIRLNIVSLDWIDNDNSNSWTSGDAVADNGQNLATGETEMVEFIVD